MPTAYRISGMTTIICYLFVLTSCGYHVGQQNAFSEYKTISVPYVEGDLDGDLTAAIVQAIACSGSFEYRLKDGALLLVVKVINLADVNIGFRYDRHRNGELSKSIIPDETRLTLIVEFSLLEAASGRLLDGPYQLAADVDVDHDYNGNNGPSDSNVNEYSLGQLSNADAAFEAAKRPLNRTIARKIRDYLSHSW
ncbi:MAG: hypothetical protein H0U49_08185 [Parachlamydiaceae bacterium]|nr:hypothetical protein [Parachlamydiaceae bacterium]